MKKKEVRKIVEKMKKDPVITEIYNLFAKAVVIESEKSKASTK